MKIFNLDFIEAKWILGLIPVEHLPEIAVEAVANGYDSKTLLLLAGSSDRDFNDVRALFDKSLREIRPKAMDIVQALEFCARSVSGQILDSEISPLQGARQIWRATLNAKVDFHDLDPFIYAASELESRPENRDLFEKAILEEARSWVDSGFGSVTSKRGLKI